MIPFSVITSYYLSSFFMDKEYLTNLDIFLKITIILIKTLLFYENQYGISLLVQTQKSLLYFI